MTTRENTTDDSLPTDPRERYHYFGRLDGENDANNGDVIPVDELQAVSEAAIIKWQMAEGLEPFTVEESVHLSDAYAKGYAAQVPVITGLPYPWPE